MLVRYAFLSYPVRNDNHVLQDGLLTVLLFHFCHCFSFLQCYCRKREENDCSYGGGGAPEFFTAEKGKISSSVEIPGELIAFQHVDLYAKVSSFVKKLTADVGSEVREGEVLAIMEAPEINAQLSGAASRLQALEATIPPAKRTTIACSKPVKRLALFHPMILILHWQNKNQTLHNYRQPKPPNAR